MSPNLTGYFLQSVCCREVMFDVDVICVPDLERFLVLVDFLGLR